MSERIQINLNDKIYVKLTQEGCDHFEAYYRSGVFADLPEKHRPPKPEPGVETDLQIWELMQIFGPRMHMGGPSMFETMNVSVERMVWPA